MAKFCLCGKDGQVREYGVTLDANGQQVIRYGGVVVAKPSEKLTFAATMALQTTPHPTETCEVIDLHDFRE